MNTRTILITGAKGGIGKLTAIDLAKQNKDAVILLHGRNKEKVDKVMEEIKQADGNQHIEGYVADLASMNEVHQLAKDVLSKHDTINVLINKAFLKISKCIGNQPLS